MGRETGQYAPVRGCGGPARRGAVCPCDKSYSSTSLTGWKPTLVVGSHGRLFILSLNPELHYYKDYSYFSFFSYFL